MPSSSNGGLYRFQLSFSGFLAESIRKLQRQATGEGRGYQFLQAMRKAVARLRTAPMQFGEPLYRLQALRLQVRCGAIGPLYIDFAVAEELQVVYIKSVKLLPLTKLP